MDPLAHEAFRGERRLRLTRTEFLLLRFFLEHPRRVLVAHRSSSRRSGATTSARAPTRSACASATCAASWRPTASRGSSTPSAASATSSARSPEPAPPPTLAAAAAVAAWRHPGLHARLRRRARGAAQAGRRAAARAGRHRPRREPGRAARRLGDAAAGVRMRFRLPELSPTEGGPLPYVQLLDAAGKPDAADAVTRLPPARRRGRPRGRRRPADGACATCGDGDVHLRMATTAHPRAAAPCSSPGR